MELTLKAGLASTKPRQSIRHLEEEGLIRRSPLGVNDRAVVLTELGRDLLQANRSIPRDERTHEPRQVFYAGLRQPRELTHDAKVYRAYERTEERIRDRGGRVRRVVLDYEMKRDYQRFLHECNRGKKECDGRPDREAEEIVRWAQRHQLPCEEDGHVLFPDHVRNLPERQRPVGRALTPEDRTRVFDSAASNPEWEHV
jgi:DNA-binding Lrp family transcriptional regulator